MSGMKERDRQQPQWISAILSEWQIEMEGGGKGIER